MKAIFRTYCVDLLVGGLLVVLVIAAQTWAIENAVVFLNTGVIVFLRYTSSGAPVASLQS